MFFVACLCGLLSLPPVRADGWDDFSNNLATDLAPFLSLFGEQITKQYLSESITLIDYFIFAMAPMGILTAVISAIRVGGSPSLRAFIGRAQEGGGNAEAELCSSTSRDVCELYNNGGIARVFGRPKILEFVHDPTKQNFADGTAGIHTFRDFIKKYPHEWNGPPLDDTESAADVFAPNLSLNIGIKSKHPAVFWAVAVVGAALQAGVLVFAIVVTYYLRWEKDGSLPDAYACPLTISGTLLVCGGNFLCAFVVGHSTNEQVFRKNRRHGGVHSSMYWVQPGGQVLGDQVFDPFCCSDGREPLQQYITSRKNPSKTSELVVWAAIGTTLAGFVMQFVGLRGAHSIVSIAQLAVIMVMSAARAALRMQRLKPEDNFLAQHPDEVTGHELDWLAMRIGGEDIQRNSKPSSLPPSPGASTSTPDRPRRYLWRFCGTPPDAIKPEQQQTSDPPNPAAKLLAYRVRLAELTESRTTQTRATTSAEHFGVTLVEVRKHAQRLALAIESTANTIFSKSSEVGGEWKNAESMSWGFACDVAPEDLPISPEQDQASTRPREQHVLHLNLKRESPEHPWRLENKLSLEGLLGLWVWSLKSELAVEGDSRSQLKVSRGTETRRILSDNRDIAETDLKFWFGGAVPGLVDGTLDLSPSQCGDPSTRWEQVWHKGNFHWRKAQSGGLPARFFGWYATELPQVEDPVSFRVWSAPTDSSLLSLCAQEVFGSFIKSILNVVTDFGDINVQKVQDFRLENSLMSHLVEIVTECQLGPRDDALLCVLPPSISRLRQLGTPTASALAAAKKRANEHRKRHEWTQAESVLRWAWGVYSKPQPRPRVDDSQDDGPVLADEPARRVAIELGDLYRWAMRGDDTKQFGSRGIRWFSDQKSGRSQPLSGAVTEILDRYSLILEQFEATSDSSDTLPSVIGEDLTQTLLNLTRSTPMTDEDKGMDLCLAAERGWAEVVLALLELGADPDFKDPDADSRTALSLAAERGSIDIVNDLLDWGVFPNSADGQHRTPLSYASEMGHGDVTAKLLGQQRVDPDAMDKDQRTPLLYAASEGHEAIVQLLLDVSKATADVPNWKKQTPLLLAAANGHEGIVKLLLNTGKANADAQDEDGNTPLLYAASEGHEAIVQLLLDVSKATTDVANWKKHTPLLLAAANGHEAIAKLLLDTGKANINAQDEERHTPLLFAVRNGHEAVVKLLLDTGGEVNPDTGDHLGRPPLLFEAAKYGHEAIAKLLLDTGKVNADAQDYSGETPLFWAIRDGHEAVVKLLLDIGKVNADAQDECQNTPLQLAAKEGHEAIVKLLLDTGAEVDTQNKFGTTPLEWAARKGHEAIVKLLLDKGANVDAQNSSSDAPLLIASEKGHEAIVKLLLDMGANVHPDDQLGWTPLSLAARYGYEVIVKLLLDMGANVDSKDTSQETPLHRAALSGSEAVVKLLLAAGANVNVRDNSGTTPLQEAASMGDEVVVKLLLDAGAETNTQGWLGMTPLQEAANRGYKATAKLLLSKGANADTQDENGWTPLQSAAMKGHDAVVELLLDIGAGIDIQDWHGMTLLHNVAKAGNEAMVERLLNKGANADTQDKKGRTALQWAAEKGHEAVVKLLLDMGANIEIQDKTGRTALQWAPEGRDEAVVELLLDMGADLEIQDENGWTALRWAAEKWEEGAMELLINKGANADTQDKKGRTPLQRVAERGREAAVKLLLDMGANTEIQDENGWTARQWAMEKRNEAVAELLRYRYKVDASEAYASEADASEAYASEADASEADASEAYASEADASEADASEADASEADASQADASQADASEADADAEAQDPSLLL